MSSNLKFYDYKTTAISKYSVSRPSPFLETTAMLRLGLSLDSVQKVKNGKGFSHIPVRSAPWR
ncbi:MAG: hypothetical protein PUP92_19645 [Rhizonema sp. PD38]|nr:hypothetical protein [Rhizonema sp. PD38]